jgi:DNA-directed RNA polymerase subunit RPC12/RpoP
MIIDNETKCNNCGADLLIKLKPYDGRMLEEGQIIKDTDDIKNSLGCSECRVYVKGISKPMNKKTIRYVVDMPLTATPINDNTPLPDPDNPFNIRKMSDEEYKEYEDN